MVGYSKLMAADEAGTIERQKAYRANLIDPKIEQYSGRIVNTAGDGMLIEFSSVIDAVQCAVEIQCTMLDREAEVPDSERIRYRVGINLGDIVIEGEDILGDGVNIAARLEGLAEPGGISVSRPVHTQIKSKLDLNFEHLGEKRVKNIPELVTVYRVVLGRWLYAYAPWSKLSHLCSRTAATPACITLGRLISFAESEAEITIVISLSREGLLNKARAQRLGDLDASLFNFSAQYSLEHNRSGHVLVFGWHGGQRRRNSCR